ncbi:hypothetical protein [Terriglobus roseus]|uniref:Uncharacterized protein n=1 Tax=Terriglobus roseus TaxID=392734 RepID=A0A1H4NTG8_9BACT|nr:hypothetical protein [Terriglobus roseus]SEB97942.1 hypothetical protein SAMN05443244_2336 [Terriglobus roseus]
MRKTTASYLCFMLLLMQMTIPAKARSQFVRNGAVSWMLCKGAPMLGISPWDKLAEFESKRLKLPPAMVAQQRRQFQIGLAMALCNGGKMVQGTLFGKMTQKDRDARQKDMDEAVASSQPVTKNIALPDNPGMTETLTASEPVMEGSNECKIVKDYVSEGASSDDALVKFCRKPPEGRYELATA